MAIILAFFTLLGFNFGFWSIIGLMRYWTEKINPNLYAENYDMHTAMRWILVAAKLSGLRFIYRSLMRSAASFYSAYRSLVKNKKFPNFINFDQYTQVAQSRQVPILEQPKIGIANVAAIIPAHNEELSIERTLLRLKAIMPAKNIYVGSDASTDRTVEIVENIGCNVVDIQPNRGKANVLTYLVKHFDLINRYQAVLIIDADSEVDCRYLINALPLFNNAEVAAIAGHASSKWKTHNSPKLNMLFSAYRVRLYRVLQAVMRYGQTWQYTNVSTIVPGFASMYRTSALKDIEINAKGLIIEDYNMTFEMHHKKLGKIAYSPSVIGISQDPINFKDYIKQVKRWNLGFWQTFKRHGLWPSYFSLSLLFYVVEMIFFAAFLLILPVALLWISAHSFEPIHLPESFSIINLYTLSFLDILIGVLAIDYLITVIVAIYERKPILLLYGLTFIIIRYIDAFLLLYTIPLAFIVKSEGRWVSPERQAFAEAG